MMQHCSADGYTISPASNPGPNPWHTSLRSINRAVAHNRTESDGMRAFNPVRMLCHAATHAALEPAQHSTPLATEALIVQ